MIVPGKVHVDRYLQGVCCENICNSLESLVKSQRPRHQMKFLCIFIFCRTNHTCPSPPKKLWREYEGMTPITNWCHMTDKETYRNLQLWPQFGIVVHCEWIIKEFHLFTFGIFNQIGQYFTNRFMKYFNMNFIKNFRRTF